MPKALENKLKKEADKKGLTGKRKMAYIYGSPIMQRYLREKRANKK